MSQTSTNSPSWNLSPSYDVGVKYTFRNLLKDNPYRQNYFRHWLATFDHESVKKYYNYETGEKRKKGELSATEIHYDQVQTMVYNANLPKEIEDELFYHLDYHLNRENKSIDFLKLKEFFAFCGVSGTYDLENKRHFLMAKESPFLLKDLNINKWTAEQKDKNRPIIARMMAAPGEIPYNREKIDTLKEQYNLEWLNAFSKTELHDKFMGRANQIFASKRTEEEVRQAAEEAERNGIDLDEYDEEIESFTQIFDKTPEAQVFLAEIKALESDEQSKLDRALAKYVPDELLTNDQLFKSYDQNLGRYGKSWDLAMHDKMGNADYWAVQYLGHEGPETCSSEPPSEEEAAQLDPELLELGEYQVARYEKMMKHFDHEVWPVLRSRYCAIEDWILRDYTMNAINKGELAKARREDIPRLFQEALRGELNDGLLKSLQFPIRIEPAEDGKNHVLWMNDLPVEVFNPAEILPELGGGNLVDHVPAPPGASFAPSPAHDFSRDIDIDQELIDFKIHSPGYIDDSAPEILPSSSSLLDGVDMPMTSPMTAQDPIPFDMPAYQQPMPRQKYAGRDRPLINGQHKRPRHEKKIYDMSNPAKSPMQRDLMRQKKNMMGNHIQELTRPPVNPRGVPNINISLPNFSFKRAADEVKEASTNLQNNAGKGDVSNELNTLKQVAENATGNAQKVIDSKEPRKYKKHVANLYRETKQALSDLSSRGLDHVRESAAFKLCEKALKALTDILRDIVKMILSIGKGNQPSPATP